MKTDIELHKDVVAELTWDPRVSEKEIGVAVKDGVVTLTGSVTTFAEKWAAERAVEGVVGVKAIANDVTVNLSSAFSHTDTEIAHKAVDALKWDIQVPNEKVKVTVTNGWVALEGDVEWHYQRDAAARAVRFLAGVRGVSNNIKVTPKQVSTYEVNKSIKAALERRADRTAERIDVSTHDGVVTLKGTVSSYGDRRAAEGAAWSAPGVTEVKDELAVVF
jgi:osmotically-inducible protein OsmY